MDHDRTTGRWAVAIFVLTTAVFLGPSLAGKALGPFDLLTRGSPVRDDVGVAEAYISPVQTDQVEQVPWVESLWRDARQGELQRWSPYIAGGVPTGTSPIFATWSVLSAPSLVVPFPWALTVRAALGLFAAQWFAFVFARRLGLGGTAAIFAGVAYGFCGGLLAFVGRNSIAMLLPALLVATDLLMERISARRVAYVAMAVGALWLEGFPSMFVYSMYAAVAWGAWQLLGTWHDMTDRRAWLGAVVRKGLAWGAAAAVGLAAVAWTVIPFAAQITSSGVLEARDVDFGPLAPMSVWWLIDPTALGTFRHVPWYISGNPYEGLASIGVLTMLLAVASAVVALVGGGPADARPRRAWTFWAFAATSLLLVNYLFDPALDLVLELPGLAANPLARTRFLLDFALVVLAATLVDRLVGRSATGDEPGTAVLELGRDGAVPATRRWAIRASALVLLGTVGWAFVPTAVDYYRVLDLQGGDVDAWGPWVLALAWAAVGGAAIIAGRLVWTERRSRWLEPAVAVVLAASVFFAIGWPLRHLTPQVPAELYYPTTEGDHRLAELTGRDHRYWGSDMVTFSPNSSMLTRMFDLRGHTLQDPEFKRLMTAVSPTAWVRDPLKLNVQFHVDAVDLASPILDDLGVRTFVSSTFESPMGDLIQGPAPGGGHVDATEEESVTLPWSTGPMSGIELWSGRSGGGCRDATVQLSTVVDGEAGPVSEKPAADFLNSSEILERRGFALDATELPDGTPVSLRVAVDGPDCAIHVGTSAAPDGTTTVAADLRRRPAGEEWRVAATRDGWYYRRGNAKELVRLTDSWRPFRTARGALRAATSPDRETDDPVPVSGTDRGPDGAAGGDVLSWSEDGSGISAQVRTDGLMLLTAAFNQGDGWSVQVDGEDAALVRPDGALLGVLVPAGTHRVRFEYDPPGLRPGALLSVAGTLTLVGLLVAEPVTAVIRRRRRGAGSNPDEGPGGRPVDGSTAPGTPADVAPG